MTGTSVDQARMAAPPGRPPEAQIKARRSTEKIGWQIALYALLIVISLIYIYPFLVQVSTSFKTDAEADDQPGLAHSAGLVDRGLRAAVPAQRLPGVVRELGRS